MDLRWRIFAHCVSVSKLAIMPWNINVPLMYSFFIYLAAAEAGKGARWGRGLGEHSPFKEGITRRKLQKEPDMSCRPTEPPSH